MLTLEATYCTMHIDSDWNHYCPHCTYHVIILEFHYVFVTDKNEVYDSK